MGTLTKRDSANVVVNGFIGVELLDVPLCFDCFDKYNVHYWQGLCQHKHYQKIFPEKCHPVCPGTCNPLYEAIPSTEAGRVSCAECGAILGFDTDEVPANMRPLELEDDYTD